MDLGLKDKVVLITGGSSGIGQATTRACLDEGAQVVAAGRRSRGVDDFIAEMEVARARFEHLDVEFSEPPECERCIDHVSKNYGELFALVNNAGVNDNVALGTGTVADFERSLRANLVHAYALAHYALPLLTQARGTIVNVASKVAVTGQGGTSGYAAAKGGLLGLTREWAADLLPFGIRVNAVIPAEVMTPAYEAWLATMPEPEQRLERIVRHIPLARRMTRTDEMAATIAFLLSPTQSGHTTGQFLHIDGGYVHLDRMLTAPDRI